MDIPSAKEIAALAGLLAPGIVILFIRARFRDASTPKLTENLVSFAVVSVAYTAVMHPIFHAESGWQLPTEIWQLLLFFVVPVIVGFAIVFFDQSETFYDWAERAGLNPAHHTPTAWDFTFRKRSRCFVIVHLTDGAEIAGAWTGKSDQKEIGKRAIESFASHVPGDRDIFISEVWNCSGGGKWTRLDPPRSILICSGTISMIEFIEGGASD